MAVYFGIRHFSPACAAYVLSFLERVQPETVLIEGPADGNEWIAPLCSMESAMPAALLAYTTEPPVQTVLWPFAEFSPEYQAMRWAVAHGVPVRFCDLPAACVLAEQSEASAPADAPAESVYGKIERVTGQETDVLWEYQFEQNENEADFLAAVVPIETMSSWFAEDDLISSVLFAFQGGMEGGTAAAELLLGEGNPSGKLSDTLAKALQDYPSSESFHESRDYVDYVEDIYVGYRYFETIPGAREKVNYPFGFGLSYTTFEVKPLEAGENHGNIQVRVQVTNTGSCAGKEVVQIYVGKPQGKLGKPDKELVAFEKTRLLQTGESQLLLLQWKVSDMASFDDLGKVKKAAYVLEKGTYVIYAGTSVRDVEKLSYSYVLEEDVITEQLTTKLAPTSLKKRMLADGTFEELPLMQANDPNASEIGKLKDEQTDGFTPEGKLVESYVLWRGMHRSGEHDFTEVADGTITMEEFLAQLSVEELAYLLGGQPNTGVANTFGFGNFPEYGIPDIMTADGPAGLRIAPEAGVNTTAFPCATLLACTWNPEIVEKIGEAGGAEVKENNIAVWLTPAINIHRSPLCGRNFEYYSEDPLLTAELAGAMVKGIQSNHIGAALKHFACNNKETNRKNCDSRVSERAAREIYLKAFERIVKEQKPWAVMSSYNIMNGHRTSEYKELLTGVLREEWGFGGMVTTDWWTCGEHYKETHAGNDLKMPRGFADRLMEAVRQGCLTREEMETSVGRILKTILKVD